MSEGPPATTSWGIELSGQFSIDMIAKFWHNASPKGSLINGLSLMYKLSKFSKLAISSGMNCKLFSPTDKYVRFDRWPIVLGKAVIWFDCSINFCRSCKSPISAGILAVRRSLELFSEFIKKSTELTFPLNGFLPNPKPLAYASFRLSLESSSKDYLKESKFPAVGDIECHPEVS